MKNITALIIISTLITACGDSVVTENQNENKTDEATIDSITPNIVPEKVVETETENVFDFSKIEHYAVFDTKSKMIENFGAENVVDGSTWYGEGSLELQHSLLTNPNNTQLIKYVWEEDNPKQLSLIEVYFEKRDSEYNVIGTQGLSSECGVFTGMTLAQLKEWNGADVEFYGFDWDFGGGVVRKEGSKISDCGILFTLGIDYGDDMEKYAPLSGDIGLSSSDAEILEAPIFVSKMTYIINKED